MIVLGRVVEIRAVVMCPTSDWLRALFGIGKPRTGYEYSVDTGTKYSKQLLKSKRQRDMQLL
jgi:hypothetical protein